MTIHPVILRQSRRISEFISDKLRDPSLTFRMTIVISFLTFNFYLLPSTAIAADSTPSADIRAKLEELKKEIASKAAKIKLEVDKKLKDKAYIGKVTKISSNSLNLETKNGPRIINMTKDTQFDNNISKKKYSQKLITQEDYLTALGDVDDIGSLTAKKIILLPTPSALPKKFLWGQVVSIADNLVTLRGRDLKNTAVALNNPSSLKTSNFVILTGSFGKNDIFEADFVYVVPQGGFLKPKKTSSPSATPKATLKPASR